MHVENSVSRALPYRSEFRVFLQPEVASVNNQVKSIVSFWSVLFLAQFLCCSTLSANELLVADRGFDTPSAVSRYDAETGEFLGGLISSNPAENGGLIFPSAMTIGPEGDLFIASQVGSVLRYDTETGDFIGTFAEGLNVPSGLNYNAENDELLVSTLGNFDSELILQYQGSTGELISTVGEGTGMSGRGSLTTGPDGNIYASSFANGEFFLGGVLQFDASTLEPAAGNFAFNPLLGLAGASGLTFHEAEDGFLLDVVGLFSNSVARFEVADGENGLAVTDSSVLISEGLDFPSAIQPLGDGTMLITSLGNDNPMTGDLRPGRIDRFDIATGAFMETYLAPGGDGMLNQPAALLLLEDASVVMADCNFEELGLLGGDFDANGQVDFADFLVLSTNFGEEVANYVDGDIDCNGVVAFEDFLVLSANFSGQAGAASVPEPTSGWLAVLGMIGLLGCRKSVAAI